MTNTTYLSKDGNTFGPFTDEALRQLEKKGELLGYQWIWKTGDSGWKRLDFLPPPPPPSQISEPAQAKPAQAVRTAITLTKTIEVLCYDRLNLRCGSFSKIDDRGAVFCVQSRESTPHFAQDGLVKLNLLDTDTGKATERKARLDRINRRSGAWEYELSWIA